MDSNYSVYFQGPTRDPVKLSAAKFEIKDGVLTLKNQDNDAVAVFAPGIWASVEKKA